MSREDIIRMALNAGIIPWEKMEWSNNRFVFADESMDGDLACLMQFADFVAAHERERIIDLNAPEIEKINAHFKLLESAVAAEREACANLCEMIADNAVMPTANECAKAIRRRQSR